MKQITLLTVVILSSISVHAQYFTNQNKVWTFGGYSGLDFTSGAPVVFTSSFNTIEGGASVSDVLGNLLFYTDGRQVWNRTGSIMPSGSSIVPFATVSTTQSSAIVQVLNNPNQYYLFSLENGGGINACHLAYSIIDMSLSGGFGDVVSSSMGILMDSLLTEKMITVPGNNCNIWLVVHKASTSTFVCYEITTSGISSIPVVSTLGTLSNYIRGVIKVSPDRQKIVCVNAKPAVGLELYDFDPNTGILSNCRVLESSLDIYGAEFSPDNSKLYATERTTVVGSTYYLAQYDLSLPTLPAIISSKIILGTGGETEDIKLAPDNKIYFMPFPYSSMYMDCISSPNSAGAACGYTSHSITLLSGNPNIGLPNLYWSVSGALPITGVTTLCQGTTKTLSDASIGGTWSSSNTGIATVTPGPTSGGVITGVSAGTAVITYSGSCGVTTTTVTVNPVPAAISGVTNICAGSTTNLSSSPGSGAWSSSNTTVTITSTGVITGVSLGTATITYVLPGGCLRTTTVTVSPAPTAITGIMSVGSATALSNSVTGGTWSSAASGIATVGTSGIVSGVSVGTAVISYSKNGCVATATLTVNQTPFISTGTANICANGTIVLSSAPGGGTWSSSNTAVATVIPTGIGGGTVAGIATGTTTIKYLLASGCFKTTTVTVVAVIPPIAGGIHVCIGQSILLSNAITGGAWSSGSTAIATVNPGTGVVTGESIGNVSITYSLGGSCITTTTITVDFSPNPGIITGPPDLCVGSTITLSNTVGGGVWSSTNTNATITPSGTVTGISSGTATIKYLVSNASCTDTAFKIITVYPVPDAGAITGPSVLCKGNTITLNDTAIGGIWSSISLSIATVTSSGVVTGVSAGTDTIKYTVSNPACTSLASKAIIVYDLPDAGTISGHSQVCRGAIFILSETTSGGIWSSSNISVATIDSNTGNVLTLSQGTTIITYTTGPNLGGCYGVATFTLTVTAQATFTINSSISQVKCYGNADGSIAVTINGGTSSFQYLWSNGNTTLSLSALDTGRYFLTVTEPATQCIGADTFHITQPDSLLLEPIVKNDFCNASTGSIILDVSGGTPIYNYIWSNNATGKEITTLSKGIYSVTVIDINGCTKRISITIYDSCNIIVIHDVLTPNGDGINDTWIIEGLSLYINNTVQIFDKWGDMVYEKTNYKNDWNGAGKSGILPDGTYYYLIKLNASNLKGNQNTFTGSLLIKR